MRNIFIGLILVFLDLYLDIGNSRIGLLPDFIGFILILKGIGELKDESEHFKRLIRITGVAIVYFVALYIMDILGVYVPVSIILVLALISTIILLVITRGIISGVRQIELNNDVFLGGSNLLNIWNPFMVTSLISIATVMIPALVIVTIIANVVISIIFLIRFNRTCNLYNHFVYTAY